MEKELFQIPAIIETIRTLSDKTLKMTVSTARELNPDEELKVLQLKQLIGWMVFSPSQVEIADVPKEEVESRNQKTPAQRLRGVLFVLWRDTTNQKNPFESFYLTQMETIINKIKEKLEQ